VGLNEEYLFCGYALGALARDGQAANLNSPPLTNRRDGFSLDVPTSRLSAALRLSMSHCFPPAPFTSGNIDGLDIAPGGRATKPPDEHEFKRERSGRWQ